MKKTLNRIKMSLATLWIALVSFSSKVFGQGWKFGDQEYYAQTAYGIRNPIGEPEIKTFAVIKSIQRLLIGVILIIGIINFIKIRKIDDKSLKKKRINRTIIILSAILIVILLLSVAVWLLKKYN